MISNGLLMLAIQLTKYIFLQKIHMFISEKCASLYELSWYIPKINRKFCLNKVKKDL